MRLRMDSEIAKPSALSWLRDVKMLLLLLHPRFSYSFAEQDRGNPQLKWLFDHFPILGWCHAFFTAEDLGEVTQIRDAAGRSDFLNRFAGGIQQVNGMADSAFCHKISECCAGFPLKKSGKVTLMYRKLV